MRRRRYAAIRGSMRARTHPSGRLAGRRSTHRTHRRGTRGASDHRRPRHRSTSLPQRAPSPTFCCAFRPRPRPLRFASRNPYFRAAPSLQRPKSLNNCRPRCERAASFMSRISRAGIAAGSRVSSSNASHRCGVRWLRTRLGSRPHKRRQQCRRAKRIKPDSRPRKHRQQRQARLGSRPRKRRQQCRSKAKRLRSGSKRRRKHRQQHRRAKQARLGSRRHKRRQQRPRKRACRPLCSVCRARSNPCQGWRKARDRWPWAARPQPPAERAHRRPPAPPRRYFQVKLLARRAR